jgi:hypothetical protein
VGEGAVLLVAAHGVATELLLATTPTAAVFVGEIVDGVAVVEEAAALGVVATSDFMVGEPRRLLLWWFDDWRNMIWSSRLLFDRLFLLFIERPPGPNQLTGRHQQYFGQRFVVGMRRFFTMNIIIFIIIVLLLE